MPPKRPSGASIDPRFLSEDSAPAQPSLSTWRQPVVTVIIAIITAMAGYLSGQIHEQTQQQDRIGALETRLHEEDAQLAKIQDNYIPRREFQQFSDRVLDSLRRIEEQTQAQRHQ